MQVASRTQKTYFEYLHLSPLKVLLLCKLSCNAILLGGFYQVCKGQRGEKTDMYFPPTTSSFYIILSHNVEVNDFKIIADERPAN